MREATEGSRLAEFQVRASISALVALALVACSDNADAPPSHITTIDDLLGPSPSADEAWDLAAEAEELTADCMAGEGHEYAPHTSTDFPPVYIDSDDADELFGYGVTVGGPPPDTAALQGLSMRDLSEYRRDWDACQDEARVEVYGRRHEVAQVLSRHLGEDLAQLERDVEEALGAEPITEWRACLDSKGYAVDPAHGLRGPREKIIQLAQEALLSSAPDGEPQSGGAEADLAELRVLELDLSATDRACQDQHLAEALAEARVAVERPFIENHWELFSDLIP